MQTVQAVLAYIAASGWGDVLGGQVGPGAVRFIAAGEYNANYRVSAPAGEFVFRINHGTQLGLAGQIAYEYSVLSALGSSGVTPVPFRVDPDPAAAFAACGEDTAPAALLGQGVLLMEFLPGGPLDYSRDSATAAEIFARIHSCPVPVGEEGGASAAGGGGQPFVVQADPVRDIAGESLGLITRYRDHPLSRLEPLLLEYHERILRLADDTAPLFASEEQVIVNTEVNSGNFLISEAASNGVGGWLVDWEKAVVSCRYQDLGHFLVPTTTRWKTAYSFDDAGRREFLRQYIDACGLDIGIDELFEKTRVLEKTILLRALSWCYMAYREYTVGGRPITNADTFDKIREYLDEIEWFLR